MLSINNVKKYVTRICHISGKIMSLSNCMQAHVSLQYFVELMRKLNNTIYDQYKDAEWDMNYVAKF